MKRLLEITAVLALLSGPAFAARVTVKDAWFRSLPGALPAAGYFIATNADSSDVALIGAEAKGCGNLMLHKSEDMGGMTSMGMADKVTIPAKGTLAFAPGGYHLMCEGAKFKLGAKVPVALRFSDGTSLVVSFAVRNAKGK